MTRSNKSKQRVRPRVSNKSKQPSKEAEILEIPAVPKIFGYARVSTAEQSLDMQLTALEKSGCDRIFSDKMSGKTAQRLQFRLMLKHLQKGDTVLVYSMSRLFRNAAKLLALFDDFKKIGVELRSLTEKSIDINTAHGRMVATVLAAVDEVEVGRVRERTIAGMSERMRQGQVMGRPRKIEIEQIKQMKELRRAKVPVPRIATRFGCSSATVYNLT